MTNLLEMKERVAKVQEAINVDLDILSIQLQEQIEGLIGVPQNDKPKQAVKKQAVKRRSLKGVKQGKRAKNDLTLSNGIARTLILLGGSATTREITKRLLKDGWKTKSKAFISVVGQAILHSGVFIRGANGKWSVR